MRTRRAHWRGVFWALCLAVPVLLIVLAVVSIAGSSVALSAAAASATASPSPTASAASSTPASAPAGVAAPGAEEASAAPTPEPDAEPALEPAPADPLHPAPCAGGTVMSVWAHSDDDLLFASAPLRAALAGQGCVRTVFLTDGDAGRGADYAAGRKRGIARAYDTIRGASSEWAEQVVTLGTGAVATLRHPVDDPRVTLVFLRLPDGGSRGEGYPATGGGSLAKLAAEKIGDLADTTGAYRVSWNGLTDTLVELLHDFAPTALYTHVPGSSTALAKGDHADHAITGIVARTAWLRAGSSAAIGYAVGYQTAGYPRNVSGADLDRKVAAFLAYAADDPFVSGCRDAASCLAMPQFGAWLTREYLKAEADLGLG